MANFLLEIVFWLVLLIYIGASITQNKKGYKNNFEKKLKSKYFIRKV